MKIEVIKGINNQADITLKKLYSSSFTTKAYIYHKFCPDNIYCFYMNDTESHNLIVCEISNDTCIICNRVCNIPNDIIVKFTDQVFETNHKIKKIFIGENRLPLLTGIVFSSLTDYCISLPSCQEEYNQEIGAESRRHYRYYLKRLAKDVEDTNIVISQPYDKERDRHLIASLCELKDIQSKCKHQPNLVKANLDEIYTMAEIYGRLSYITVKGKAVSILLFYKVEKEYYFIQTAFDNSFSKYSLSRGLLYHTILKSIEEECTKFHFLWGGLDYKKHYAAKEHQLYSSYIFREKTINYYTTVQKVWLLEVMQNFKASKLGSYIKIIYKRIRY